MQFIIRVCDVRGWRQRVLRFGVWRSEEFVRSGRHRMLTARRHMPIDARMRRGVTLQPLWAKGVDCGNACCDWATAGTNKYSKSMREVVKVEHSEIASAVN